MFAGEAYNVEMGISNQLFPQERDGTPGCQPYSVTPNDSDNFITAPGYPAMAVLSDIEAFANFVRCRAARPCDTHSVHRGRSSRVHQRGLRGVPHALVHDGSRNRHRILADTEPGLVGSSRESLFRSHRPSHGTGFGRWHNTRSGGSGSISYGTPMGPRPASVLPARWPHVQFAGGHRGSRELGKRGQRDRSAVQCVESTGAAKYSEFPPVIVRSARAAGAGYPAPFRASTTLPGQSAVRG